MPIHHAPSRKKLLSVHPHLQQVVHAAADRMELIVVCGHRGKNEQNLAFTTGRSKLSWPHSKHNQLPSLAVDLAPLQPDGSLSWDDIRLFQEMGEIVKQEAARLRIDIRWGGDFKTWKDYPHFELTNLKQDPPAET